MQEPEGEVLAAAATAAPCEIAAASAPSTAVLTQARWCLCTTWSEGAVCRSQVRVQALVKLFAASLAAAVVFGLIMNLMA